MKEKIKTLILLVAQQHIKEFSSHYMRDFLVRNMLCDPSVTEEEVESFVVELAESGFLKCTGTIPGNDTLVYGFNSVINHKN